MRLPLPSVFLCIDEYKNDNPIGRLYRLDGTEERFGSLLHCLRGIERTLEEGGAVTAGGEWLRSTLPWRRGRLGTFEVRVLFQQRSSWQGLLTWVEGERKETFGSVWELIQQMDRIIRHMPEGTGTEACAGDAQRNT